MSISAAPCSIAAMAFAALLARSDVAWAQDARTERVQFRKVFNIVAPGAQAATFIGSTQGNAVDLVLPSAGGRCRSI